MEDIGAAIFLIGAFFVLAQLVAKKVLPTVFGVAIPNFAYMIIFATLANVLDLIPEARVGHIGLTRDEETLEPIKYYCKIPKDKDAEIILIDPMLATGGSAAAALTMLKEEGYKHFRFMCLVAAPEGVELVNREHPDVPSTLQPWMTISTSTDTSYRAWEMPGTGCSGRWNKPWKDLTGTVISWKSQKWFPSGPPACGERWEPYW